MTLNKRLETAAAAIVQRITTRSKPRVLRAVSPFNNGSTELVAIAEDMRRTVVLQSIKLKMLNCPLGRLGRTKTKVSFRDDAC